MADTILRSDLTEQHIKDAGRRIEMEAQEVDDLSQFFEDEPFPDKKVDVKFRVRIPTHISPSEVEDYRAHENIAPANRELKYASFAKTVKSYDTRHEYTRENVEDNPDSVVADCTDDLGDWATDIKKFSAALALLAAKSSVTPIVDGNSKVLISETAEKADLILNDNLQSESFTGNEYLAIAPGAVIKKLRKEIMSANGGNTFAALPKNDQAKILKGYEFSWENFAWFSPKGSNKFLQDSTNYYIIFVGKDEKGRNPLRRLKKSGQMTEVLHHPLGSGILKNAKGEIVPDYNNQKGGIGCNMRGFLYYIKDYRFVLICTIAKSAFTGIDVTTEIPADGDDDGGVYQTLERVVNGHGGTVSSSNQTFAISAVAAAGVTLGTGSATVTAVTTKVQLKANHDCVWYIAAADAAKASVDVDGLVTLDASLVADTTVTVKAFDGMNEATFSVVLDVA